jgi:hypothetical protein
MKPYNSENGGKKYNLYTYILYDHKHTGLRHKILDRFTDNFEVWIHEITNGLHLSFHLRVKTAQLACLIEIKILWFLHSERTYSGPV